MLKRLFLSTGLSWLWLSVLIIALDRYSKDWVMHHLVYLQPLKILPVLNFTLAYNTGAAFSFLHAMSGWQNILFGGLAIIVSFVVLVWLGRSPKQERWVNAAMSLILAGALGNAWDRFLYAFVIDFIDVHWGDWHFAIFNVADSAICVGAFMLFLKWMRHP